MDDSAFFPDADTFFQKHAGYGLTFDDVSLATRYSETLPRDASLEVQLSPFLKLSLPIISSDMDTVTEERMAIAMAENGGMGIIHYNMSEKAQVRAVAKVKNNIHGLIQEPIKMSPEKSIADVLELIESKGYKFSTFPVVDGDGRLQGLLPGRVVKQRYRHLAVADAMTPRSGVFTVNEREIENNPIEVADEFFNNHIGIHKLLVVDDEDRLRGLFTLSDIEGINEERRQHIKPARDASFRLVCGAAICILRNRDGSIARERILAHVSNLCAEGVDCVAVSTAHAHTASVGEVVRLIRNEFPELTILAGNVTTGEGVRFLAESGANVVKIGQGPGSICTTRIVAGVGIPQLTALYVASREARRHGVRIVADGGITKSGDIVKALTLADAAILGSLLAGCPEAPGKIMEIDGKLYKQYRGMGSLEAMKEGSAARYGHAREDLAAKATAEGVEALKEISGTCDSVLADLAGGIRSGMGYLGATNLEELKANARFTRITGAGLRESAPHSVIEVKTTKT